MNLQQGKRTCATHIVLHNFNASDTKTKCYHNKSTWLTSFCLVNEGVDRLFFSKNDAKVLIIMQNNANKTKLLFKQ